MIADFLSMNGYGLYVWASFSAVMISCAVVILELKKLLKNMNKSFLAELQALTLEEKSKAIEILKLHNKF